MYDFASAVSRCEIDCLFHGKDDLHLADYTGHACECQEGYTLGWEGDDNKCAVDCGNDA